MVAIGMIWELHIRGRSFQNERVEIIANDQGNRTTSYALLLILNV